MTPTAARLCARILILSFFCWCVALADPVATSGRDVAPPSLGRDDRFKTDILLIVAHPDDETGDLSGYLARAIKDEHRRVAVVFTTRAEEGDNAVGTERGDALGAEREIEGRRALASVGVHNVWFLSGPNASSQNVLRALERWDHGSVLGQVVRLVRLTRPEVIISWLPASVAGENHADHQAAGVIATEAFDLAGDPVAFGEQLAVDVSDGKATEGLSAWQPKKIYYYSDALEYQTVGLRLPPLPSTFRPPFLVGKGPRYSNVEISPAEQQPYSALSAAEASFYLTQDAADALEALRTHDFKRFEPPIQFVFGKSLVGGSPTGDIFENIVPRTIAPYRPLRPAAVPQEPAALELGAQWAYYREFWRAHEIEHLTALLPIPEIAIQPRVATLQIPFLMRNTTHETQELTLTPKLPMGWTDRTRFSTYRLIPGEVRPVQAVLAVPDAATRRWEELRWTLSAGGRQIGSVLLRVDIAANGAMLQ